MLIVDLPRDTSVDALEGLRTSGKALTVQIDTLRQKRSLNANNYCWKLCQDIAEASSTSGAIITREQVYRRNIKELFAPVVRPVPKSDLEFWLAMWRERGTGWLAEKLGASDLEGCVEVGFWAGSSTFDTKQMSRLIEGLIEDARALGLQILSEADKALLLENWKPKTERG